MAHAMLPTNEGIISDILVERLASRRVGKVPGHANVPQLSPWEGD
ncbi:MAG TPA: hypothetical protein VN946_13650 [Terriglobales bacterium]|jgi:hypothetical protein|nr:hypothetical protein [Terriglobales bacterium]